MLYTCTSWQYSFYNTNYITQVIVFIVSCTCIVATFFIKSCNKLHSCGNTIGIGLPLKLFCSSLHFAFKFAIVCCTCIIIIVLAICNKLVTL